MIDVEPTLNNFNNVACLSQSKLARCLKVEKTLISLLIRGKYKSMKGRKAKRVLEDLRSRGVLVELPDEETILEDSEETVGREKSHADSIG